MQMFACLASDQGWGVQPVLGPLPDSKEFAPTPQPQLTMTRGGQREKRR
jgi:hypothetical protein